MKAEGESAVPIRQGLGDPRPILTEFLLAEYKKQVSYYRKRVGDGTGMVYGCYEDQTKQGETKLLRRLRTDPAVEKEASGVISDCGKKFVVFHVILEQKAECKEAVDGKQHGVTVLYNRVTGRLYLYDLLRYHTRGFRINMLNSQLKKNTKAFLEENDFGWMDLEGVDEDERDVTLVNMDPALTAPRVKKFLEAELGRSAGPTDWYPLLALWEIHMMIQNPTLLRTELTEKMVATKSDDLEKLLRKLLEKLRAHFISVYARDDAKCDEDWLYIAENGACVANVKGLDSETTASVIAEKKKELSIRQLTVGSVKKEDFVRMGNVKGQTVMLMYLKERYGVGAYLPRNIRSRELDKELISFQWDWNEMLEKHELKLHKLVAAGFQKVLKDPKTDKAVIFVRMIAPPAEPGGSYGLHLNALLVDKKRGEVEHFEPHGSQLGPKYEPEKCYELLRAYFAKMGLKYISPMEFLPNMQFPQNEESRELGFMDEYGACAIWCMWYIEVRLSNWETGYGRDQVLRKAMRAVKRYGSFRLFVRNYEKAYMHMITFVVNQYLNGTLEKRKIQWDPRAYIPNAKK